MPRVPVALCIAALSLSACGDDHDHGMDPVNCATESRADTFTANMVKTGEMGVLKVKLMNATPAPPDKGDNNWQVEVLTASDTPVDGATIDSKPFMPDHGHGTTINETVTPMGMPGQYEIDRINLWMPGLWEITLDITSAAGSDQVLFKFCVEG